MRLAYVSRTLGAMLLLSLSKNYWITKFKFHPLTNGCSFFLVTEIAPMQYDACGSEKDWQRPSSF
jgi:hypothetical protein